MTRFYTILLILCLMVPVMGYSQSREVKVILTDGPDRDIVAMLQTNASTVMTALNNFNGGNGQLQLPASIRDGDGAIGLERLSDLARTNGIRTNASELYSQVIMLNNNTYQIRRLYVSTNSQNDSKTLELVLTFDRDGRLTDAQFAMAEHQFDMILKDAISLLDDYRRRQIINYLEQFKTAYNRKDVDYIELQFSDKALIITGTRIAVDEAAGNAIRTRQTEEYQERYRLVSQTKAEYIGRLRDNIFKINSFISVDFSGINILQHPEYDDVYWVSVLQTWSSSTYSDTGYLSFLIDFSNEDQPLIYVRAWQPEPFDDGTLIDLNMFEIIR